MRKHLGWALRASPMAVLQTEPGSGATRGVCPEKDCDTAWIDGRDPLYTKVADAWMKEVIADFGTDHAWQMDAFCEAQLSQRTLPLIASDARRCRQLGTVPAGESTRWRRRAPHWTMPSKRLR